MSYTKTTWQNGDIITAEKLNNMENGIANVSNTNSQTNITLTETISDTDPKVHTLNVTYEQIANCLQSGGNICVVGEVEEITNVFMLQAMYLNTTEVLCFRIIGENSQNFAIGYYVPSIWDDNKYFYSETASGTMTWTEEQEQLI